MPSPNEITPAQLNRLIGTPDCPLIVDICTNEDFNADPFLIPTSIRHSHKDMPGLVELTRIRHTVIVCHKGKKLSQGAMSWLRSEGVSAEYLQGGVLAWRDLSGALNIPATAIPARVEGATLWVTRHRPKIDRIACPWLIKRFVDPNARFLFVAPAEVDDVADRFGAMPFDTPNAEFSDQEDRCTFDSMLDHFHLHNTSLDRMAQVIRAADTNQLANVPQAAGLLALSVGLSRQFKDDHQQLNQALPLYDALYRWARDGFNETHEA